MSKRTNRSRFLAGMAFTYLKNKGTVQRPPVQHVFTYSKFRKVFHGTIFYCDVLTVGRHYVTISRELFGRTIELQLDYEDMTFLRARNQTSKP